LAEWPTCPEDRLTPPVGDSHLFWNKVSKKTKRSFKNLFVFLRLSCPEDRLTPKFRISKK
jgi:hypothetical protein